MLERLVILVSLVVLFTLAVLATRHWTARRTSSLRNSAASSKALWDSLSATPDGRGTLVAFSSPSCAACHTAQAPAVHLAQEQLGAHKVRVIDVDAASQPHIARAFGVLTVPSTVVLAPTGSVVAVNHGFAPSSRLVEQLKQR